MKKQKTMSNKKTNLQQLKDCYDLLGIQYHELKENGYTYIQKINAHEEPGKIYVEREIGVVELKTSSQLTDFFEFDKTGKLVSW